MSSSNKFYKSKRSEIKEKMKEKTKGHEEEEESESENEWSGSSSESESNNTKIKGLVTVIKTERDEEYSHSSSSSSKSDSDSNNIDHAAHSKRRGRDKDANLPVANNAKEDSKTSSRKRKRYEKRNSPGDCREDKYKKRHTVDSNRERHRVREDHSNASNHHGYDDRRHGKPYSDKREGNMRNRHEERRKGYSDLRCKDDEYNRGVSGRHHRSRSSEREEMHDRRQDYRGDRGDRDRSDADRNRSRNGRELRRNDRKKFQRPHRERPDEGRPKVESESENWADSAPMNKEEPNFGLSGKLTEFTNTYNGVVIKYNEPPEARKPRTRWRLYPFKGDANLAMLHIHRQSAYLFGRDRKIADIPVDHPSCSKQHSVLQFRLVDYERPDGITGKRVKPYIIDLESTNGTYVNNRRIDPRRYVELIEKDVLKFGFSTREYVILHEKSKDDESDEETELTESKGEKD